MASETLTITERLVFIDPFFTTGHTFEPINENSDKFTRDRYNINKRLGTERNKCLKL